MLFQAIVTEFRLNCVGAEQGMGHERTRQPAARIQTESSSSFTIRKYDKKKTKEYENLSKFDISIYLHETHLYVKIN